MNSTKTIIIFGPEGPNVSAEGVVTLKLMNLFRKHHWNVIWIYHELESHYNNVNKTDNIEGIFICINNLYLHKLSKWFKHIPVLKYIYHLDSLLWSYKAYKKAQKIHRRHPVDYTFSRIMPQYGHLPALLFSKKTHVPWIANWSDPMPRNKAPEPYGAGINSPISKNNKFYLNKICKYAKAHTFPSSYLKDYYLQYLPANSLQCYVLPHVIDKNIKIPYHQHESLIMSHIGGGLIQRNPTLFFNALKNVKEKERYKNLQLKINFVGPIEKYIIDIVNELQLTHIVSFTGKLPYIESLKHIQDSDILLIIEAPMKEGIFLPSKITDVLSYHKPIFAISPPKGVLKSLINTYKGGLIADCLSQLNIEERLKSLFDDWKKNRLQSDKYQTSMLFQQFSEDTIWKQLQLILNNLHK